MIREFDPTRDYPDVRALMVELQEVERPMDPALPPGDDIADDYLAWMFRGCAESDGRMFVHESGGRVSGFVCVLARAMPDEPDEPQRPFAWMGELVVSGSERGRGVGDALLKRAEAFARERGAAVLRTKALAGNDAALGFYERRGFSFREIELEKKLR